MKTVASFSAILTVAAADNPFCRNFVKVYNRRMLCEQYTSLLLRVVTQEEVVIEQL